MSSTDANALREKLGDATGIVVQARYKDLSRRGIEVVSRAGLEPSVLVYYRGELAGVVYPAGPAWTLGSVRFKTLVAATLYAVLRHIETD